MERTNKMDNTKDMPPTLLEGVEAMKKLWEDVGLELEKKPRLTSGFSDMQCEVHKDHPICRVTMVFMFCDETLALDPEGCKLQMVSDALAIEMSCGEPSPPVGMAALAKLIESVRSAGKDPN